MNCLSKIVGHFQEIKENTHLKAVKFNLSRGRHVFFNTMKELSRKAHLAMPNEKRAIKIIRQHLFSSPSSLTIRYRLGSRIVYKESE